MKKGEKKNTLERLWNPAYFLTSAHLAARRVKWGFLLNSLFWKKFRNTQLWRRKKGVGVSNTVWRALNLKHNDTFWSASSTKLKDTDKQKKRGLKEGRVITKWLRHTTWVLKAPELWVAGSIPFRCILFPYSHFLHVLSLSNQGFKPSEREHLRRVLN